MKSRGEGEADYGRYASAIFTVCSTVQYYRKPGYKQSEHFAFLLVVVLLYCGREEMHQTINYSTYLRYHTTSATPLAMTKNVKEGKISRRGDGRLFKISCQSLIVLSTLAPAAAFATRLNKFLVPCLVVLLAD